GKAVTARGVRGSRDSAATPATREVVAGVAGVCDVAAPRPWLPPAGAPNEGLTDVDLDCPEAAQREEPNQIASQGIGSRGAARLSPGRRRIIGVAHQANSQGDDGLPDARVAKGPDLGLALVKVNRGVIWRDVAWMARQLGPVGGDLFPQQLLEEGDADVLEV